MSQEMQDVSVYFRPLLEVRDVILLTHRVLQEFPNTNPPEFKPWYPSLLDSQKPIRPQKPPPLISSEDPLETRLHPKDPSETRLHPKDPSETRLHPKDPSETRLHPKDPSETRLHPKDPIETRLHPKNPSETCLHPKEPRETCLCFQEPPLNPEDPSETRLHPKDPRDTSEPRPGSKLETQPKRFQRSWCVITDRTAPLKITRSFSRLFRRTIESHGLDLRQRVRWVVCEQNCGARGLEELWLQLNRAIRRSRLPTCNANFQRALAQIWLFCDVFYCEYIGNFLKQEFQLSGKITLTVHKLGDIMKL